MSERAGFAPLARRAGLLMLAGAISGCAPVALRPLPVECTLAILVTKGIGGCETTPLMSDALDQEGKRFAPAPGKAHIYVVRPSVVGGRFLWGVQVDGRPVGALAARTYLLLEVEPGAHEVTAVTAENRHTIAVTANPGENHFVEAVSTMGWAQSRAELRTLPQEQGKATIHNARRAES